MRSRTSKSRVRRICQEILQSKKWQKVRRVDIGVPDPKDPDIPEVRFRKGVKRYLAQAGKFLTFSTEYYLRTDNQSLKNTIAHEMIHYYLQKNGIYDGHGSAFKTLCSAYGLNNPRAKEADWKYQYVCPCGWWYKTNKTMVSIRCKRCGKILVSPTEYKRLRKIAEIKSKVYPVNIEKYVPWTLKRSHDYSKDITWRDGEEK
jgi:predicted SprT family Zn-dependent metalloprotease